MKQIYLSILSCFIMLVASAEAIPDTTLFTGEWKGMLKAGTELHIIFNIKENPNGGLLSTLDSPDQSVYGLKCDTTFVNGGKVTIQLRRLQASYTGMLVNDSTIEGIFTQGAAFSITLNRTTETPAELPKQVLIPNTKYKNTEVTVKANNVTLSGTLFQTLNGNKSPVVLIIAGSGPTNRDGNSAALPGKNNSLLQLADSLAQYGIASLRYDKRGVGKSNPETVMSEESITINDIADDAAAMYGWLKKQGYKSIYIAGHSEGSLIGMMIAQKVKPKGFISIAGAGRKAGDILKEQLSGQLTGKLKTQFANDIDSLEHGLSVTAVDPSLMSLLRPSIQPYMRSWLALDPQKLISQLKCSILIIQGTKDLQVKEIDAQNLFKARQKSKLILVANMNHVLKEVVSEDRKDNIKAYEDPNLPLKKELMTAIVNFINQPNR